MSTTVMQENSRSPAKTAAGGDPEPGREQPSDASPPSTPPEPAAAPANRFVGHAMRALFESSDVSIRRGDETRVMSRAQEALAEIQRKTASPPAPPKSAAAAVPTAEPGAPISSRPPAPRVDAVLWIVLAVGLFAIAGWMVAYAL